MIVIFIVIGIAIASSIVNKEHNEINKWATSKGLEVSKIELHYTSIYTPYYYVHKGCNIYEVDMVNGEKWWIRTGIFSNDYEKD